MKEFFFCKVRNRAKSFKVADVADSGELVYAEIEVVK